MYFVVRDICRGSSLLFVFFFLSLFSFFFIVFPFFLKHLIKIIQRMKKFSKCQQRLSSEIDGVLHAITNHSFSANKVATYFLFLHFNTIQFIEKSKRKKKCLNLITIRTHFTNTVHANALNVSFV